MIERGRKPSENKLARILIKKGWNVRANPPKEAHKQFWDFYRAGNSLVPLNPKAEKLLKDFEQSWRNRNWPPER